MILLDADERTRAHTWSERLATGLVVLVFLALLVVGGLGLLGMQSWGEFGPDVEVVR